MDYKLSAKEKRDKDLEALEKKVNIQTLEAIKKCENDPIKKHLYD